MEQKLNEYAKKFGENFPIFMVRGMSEDKVVKTIDECIKNNKPYEVETDDDVSY